MKKRKYINSIRNIKSKGKLYAANMKREQDKQLFIAIQVVFFLLFKCQEMV